MVGFNPDGSVANYSVLEHKETPGLGSKMDVWFTSNGKGNITGKTPGTQGLKVSKDGGRQCGCSFRSNTTNKIIYDFRFTMNLKS